MHVLILSPYGDLLEDTVTASGHHAIIRPETLEVSDWPSADWVVSFGYRKIIQSHTIEKFKGRIINIHCSLLPWNRGAHPNFWSWFDGTSKGVSIHRVDEGIDTGEILARGIIDDMDFRYPASLQSTYNDLLIAAAGLFKRNWPEIVSGRIQPQTHLTGKGSYHTVSDIDKFKRFMPYGWEGTSVSDVVALGKLYRGLFYG